MSNRDRIEGRAKETAGKVTGDDRLEAEGRTQRAKGTVQRKAEEAKDAAKGTMDAVRDAVTSDDDEDEDAS